MILHNLNIKTSDITASDIKAEPLTNGNVDIDKEKASFELDSFSIVAFTTKTGVYVNPYSLQKGMDVGIDYSFGDAKYFGIVANGVDDNMSKMTSDLYYTQLCEINDYSVNDKRVGIRMASTPDTSDFEDGKISLYAVISKKENTSKWISTITIFDSSKNATLSEAKEYDSFYKK